MGGLQDDPEECDYVFMRPTSLPVLKCEIESRPTNQTQLEEENVYLIPRRIEIMERDSPSMGKYPMVDMSELLYPPEQPEFTSEVVTPDRNPLKGQNQSRSHRFSGETYGVSENRVFRRNPQKYYDVKLGPKSSSPTEKRALLVKKKAQQDKATSSDRVGSYVNITRNSPEKQIDVKSDIRTRNSEVGLATPRGFSLTEKENSERNSEHERKISHLHTNDQTLNRSLPENFHFVECYYLEPTSQNRNLPIPPLPPYNPPEPPSAILGQRRLPPTPFEEYLDFQSNNKSSERNKPQNQQTAAKPETTYSRFKPTQTQSPVSSKPRWIYEETPQKFSRPPLLSRSSEPCLLSEASASSKVKSTSLFGKTLLSKNSVFCKNSKLEKSSSGSNLIEKTTSLESSSPKFSKKIHPIADMIKKRRGTMHNLLISATSLTKSSQGSDAAASSQENVYGFVSSSSPDVSESIKAKASKPCLAVTKSLPLPDSVKKFTPPEPKHLISVQSHPGFSSTDFAYANISQNQPESSRSFLYQPVTSRSNSSNDVTTPQVITRLSSAVSFKGIADSEVESNIYDSPFHSEHNTVSERSPTRSNNETKMYFARRIGHTGGVQTLLARKAEKAKHGNRSRILSQDQLDGNNRLPSSSSNVYSATFSPGQLYVRNDAQEPPTRPPPPSLTKIREARLKSTLNNTARRKMNRSLSESGFLDDQSDVTSPDARNCVLQKQRHFSNAEMFDEDPPYSTIPDLTESFRKTPAVDSRNFRHHSYSAFTPSIVTRSQLERINQRHKNVANRGSVESTESDLSLRDMEGMAIYEDINDFNFDMGLLNAPFWAAPHQSHKVQVGKM